MPSFLKNISKFYGTGEKNAAGQSLEEFLERYDPYKYPTPSCTTDAVIFSYEGESCETIDGLKVLLVKRSNHPGIGYWALPGGFVNLKENLEDTARRELEEETGVRGLVMEQVAAYGDYDRDPRTRVITTAYMALVHRTDVKVRAGDDAADAVWCGLELKEMPNRVPGTEKEENMERDKNRKFYRLNVKCEERGFETDAYVEYAAAGHLIREEKYTVTRQGEIASDHAAIIVQALLRLDARLRKRS